MSSSSMPLPKDTCCPFKYLLLSPLLHYMKFSITSVPLKVILAFGLALKC